MAGNMPEQLPNLEAIAVPGKPSARALLKTDVSAVPARFVGLDVGYHGRFVRSDS